MKEKVLRFILVITLITTLIGIHFILLGNHIVIAVYEDLGGQRISINNEKILFDVFLEDNNNKVHSKISKIQEGAVIKVNVTVNNGILSNGKIILENHLAIQDDNLKNGYISSVNTQEGIIELNPIANGEKIEIDIPVKLKKQDQINIENFDKETEVKLEGEYKEEEKTPKNIEGKVKIKIQWTDDAEILLEQKIDKFVNLGENGVFLQQKIEIRSKR